MNANALKLLSSLLVCALSCASEPAASESDVDVDAGPGVAASASSVDSGAHHASPGPARDAATDSRPAQGSAAGAAAINSQPAVAGGAAASAIYRSFVTPRSIYSYASRASTQRSRAFALASCNPSW